MSKLKCLKCGKEVDEKEKYCLNCGFELQTIEAKEKKEEIVKDDLICKKCGTLLKENQQFCPKCSTEKGFTNNKKCLKCGAKAKIDIQSDLIDKKRKLKM